MVTPVIVEAALTAVENGQISVEELLAGGGAPGFAPGSPSAWTRPAWVLFPRTAWAGSPTRPPPVRDLDVSDTRPQAPPLRRERERAVWIVMAAQTSFSAREPAPACVRSP